MAQFGPKNPEFDARVRDSFDLQQVMHTLGIGIADPVAEPYRSMDGAQC